MAKRDRTTGHSNTSIKSRHWTATAYNNDIELLKDVKSYPSYINKVYGGEEKCKTTDRLHYQAHIQCNENIRMSTLKSWLPNTHFEKTKNVMASMNYSMKADTAVGDKNIIINPTASTYYTHSDILIMVMNKCIEYYDKEKLNSFFDDISGSPAIEDPLTEMFHGRDFMFTFIYGRMIEEDIKFVNYFSNDLKNKWNLFADNLYRAATRPTRP